MEVRLLHAPHGCCQCCGPPHTCVTQGPARLTTSPATGNKKLHPELEIVWSACMSRTMHKVLSQAALRSMPPQAQPDAVRAQPCSAAAACAADAAAGAALAVGAAGGPRPARRRRLLHRALRGYAHTLSVSTQICHVLKWLVDGPRGAACAQMAPRPARRWHPLHRSVCGCAHTVSGWRKRFGVCSATGWLLEELRSPVHCQS